MVSIQSEDVNENGSDSELIVPEVLEPQETPLEIKEEIETKVSATDSWPTLEILPGGVIKHADKTDDESSTTKSKDSSAEKKEMMYACAKCSQSFKHLFSLVKHVKSHEEDQKRQKRLDLAKLNTTSSKDEYCLQPKRKKVVITKLKKKPKRLKS